jgi:5'-nucleotidase
VRILVTNDDGINAEGLKIAEAIAEDVAGSDGEVWTIAPELEKSGVSHCTSYTTPCRVENWGERRFSVDGFPADCVLAGVHHLMADARPDLVLSGVNRGNNSAENVLYSGTCGAAIEAALQGIPAIALSQFYGPENVKLASPFEAASAFGADIVRRVLKHDTWHQGAYHAFYNVNFPPVPASGVKGTMAAPQGRRKDVAFGMQSFGAPNGRDYLWITGGDQRAPSAEGTDSAVNLEGYISVTPLTPDLTAHDMMRDLKGAFD